jgi:hypothetical protein
MCLMMNLMLSGDSKIPVKVSGWYAVACPGPDTLRVAEPDSGGSINPGEIVLEREAKDIKLMA